MKRMKKLLVCLMTTVLILGICLPANTQTASAVTEAEQKTYEMMKGSMIEPEKIWTNGTQLLDGKGTLWSFKQYIDGHWSMEGIVSKTAENLVDAGGIFVTADGIPTSTLEGWPEDKKIKWADTKRDVGVDGKYSYAVVDEDGNLWVWGEAHDGNLGVLEQDGFVEKPKKIMKGVEKAYFITGGGCAIKEDGTLWSWGSSGPFIKESDKDAIVWYEHDAYGYNEYATTSKPVKVMSNVKDIWWSGEIVVLKTDNSLYVDKKKVDEDVVDVFVCLANESVNDKFLQTVLYLKEDGTLWGYGMPYNLGLEKGNTYFVEKGYTYISAGKGEVVVPDKKIYYQCVPTKLMENVVAILNGSHYEGLVDQIYVMNKYGAVFELSHDGQKKISPNSMMYLFYYELEEELNASEQKIKDGIESTTIKVKSAITADGKIKLTWTKSKGYGVDYYEVYRSTSKTKAFNQQYVTSKGTQKSYKNTSVKKGTRYYYAVRGVREINGQKYYTQWSNLANRKVQ